MNSQWDPDPSCWDAVDCTSALPWWLRLLLIGAFVLWLHLKFKR